ncbi:SRPBCC family protein [Rhodococcus sp. TAF43]|uniref:SRPBCC family protein n=1 Tax=unclassified Rhodococcus (in: high G+C Gram-positive bacteria) TaxID=192944 RepID=UPI001582C5DD|nr:SRPBCC family protein [Rhodococcus sp. W8901]QKT09803.1 SRPBCC family protein [Rhodococcus sp. W8901]
MVRSLVRSVVVSADPDRVWSHIGDFDRLGAWHPGVPPSELEGDTEPTEVGAIRVFSIDGRVVARELLVGRDAAARTYSYQVLDPMLPISDYIATLAVRPHAGGTEIHWSAEYQADDDAAVATVEQMFGDGVYVTGLNAVATYFAD